MYFKRRKNVLFSIKKALLNANPWGTADMNVFYQSIGTIVSQILCKQKNNNLLSCVFGNFLGHEKLAGQRLFRSMDAAEQFSARLCRNRRRHTATSSTHSNESAQSKRFHLLRQSIPLTFWVISFIIQHIFLDFEFNFFKIYIATFNSYIWYIPVSCMVGVSPTSDTFRIYTFYLDQRTGLRFFPLLD